MEVSLDWAAKPETVEGFSAKVNNCHARLDYREDYNDRHKSNLTITPMCI
jgi:hypothetical protein